MKLFIFSIFTNSKLCVFFSSSNLIISPGSPLNLYGPSGIGISLVNQAIQFLPANEVVAFCTLISPIFLLSLVIFQ